VKPAVHCEIGWRLNLYSLHPELDVTNYRYTTNRLIIITRHQLTIRLSVGLNLIRRSEATLIDILPAHADASKLIILYLHKVWICLGEPHHRHCITLMGSALLQGMAVFLLLFARRNPQYIVRIRICVVLN
jgi:hypothetical protein